MIMKLTHPQPEQISSFAFTPDGTGLAVACPTHVIHLWNLRELDREQAALGIDSGLSALRKQPTAPASPLRVTLADR
jgi:WD40 repeat protein